MKLNPDCVRDILMSVEDVTNYYRTFEYKAGEKVDSRLAKYSHDEIIYHIHQCRLAGLLFQCEINWGANYISVDDLTPDGHEFLANTRKNAIWEKAKDIADEIGTSSATSLAEIAKNIVITLIKNRFGIT